MKNSLENTQGISLNAVVNALQSDAIPFTKDVNCDGSIVLTVEVFTKITIDKDGHIFYTHKGKYEDLVFERPDDIAGRVVDEINMNGIGNSAFGIF